LDFLSIIWDCIDDSLFIIYIIKKWNNKIPNYKNKDYK